MNIRENTVATIDYTLRNDAGEVIDSSEGGEPLTYLHGHGNIVPGLEEALEGKAAGDALQVAVPPESGYGLRDAGRRVEVSRAELPSDLEPEPGMQLVARTSDGGRAVLWVESVSEDTVTLDGNHPLAGETLHFAVTVREVRAASAEELAHGHVHGPGGHH